MSLIVRWGFSCYMQPSGLRQCSAIVNLQNHYVASLRPALHRTNYFIAYIFRGTYMSYTRRTRIHQPLGDDERVDNRIQDTTTYPKGLDFLYINHPYFDVITPLT